MESLFNEEEFSDIVLNIFDENNEVSFPAHSLILANKSNYFRTILRLYKNKPESLKVDISNIGSVKSALEIIQKCIYENNILTEKFINDNVNLLNFFLIDNKIYTREIFNENLEGYLFIIHGTNIKNILKYKKMRLMTDYHYNRELIQMIFILDWNDLLKLQIEFFQEQAKEKIVNFLKTAIPDLNLDLIRLIKTRNNDEYLIENVDYIKLIMRKLYDLDLIREHDRDAVLTVFQKLEL